MKSKFIISKEEKKLIQKKYGLIYESNGQTKEEYQECVKIMGEPESNNSGDEWSIPGVGKFEGYQFYSNMRVKTPKGNMTNYSCSGKKVVIKYVGQSKEEYQECVKQMGKPTSSNSGEQWSISGIKSLSDYQFYSNMRVMKPDESMTNYSCSGKDIVIDGEIFNISGDKTAENNDFFKCLENFKKYANSIRNTELKTQEVLQTDKDVLISCWSKFKDDRKFINSIGDKDLDLIIMPPGDLLKYQIPLKENFNKPNIYIKENNGMSNIIKKIVKEHNLRKQNEVMVESNIIKNRFNFILETRNNSRNISQLKRNLKKEKSSLIKNGYDVNMVNENFIDIMNTLFASDNKNILTDIKKRLGDKIANVFKFEMLRSVFEQISDNDLRTALEKKDPDLISGPIVDKIIESYKSKYPEDKILNLVFDSISKKELQKKITDIIKDDFSKTILSMDDLMTKVRNVVSGNSI